MTAADLPEDAILDVKPVAFVCRHQPGQFSEQTGVKEGKAKLTGATQQPELVAEFVDAFPFTVMATDLVNKMYDDDDEEKEEVTTKHKEELPSRKDLDKKERDLILVEFQKYPHPLEDTRSYLFNPTNGRRAPPEVNV